MKKGSKKEAEATKKKKVVFTPPETSSSVEAAAVETFGAEFPESRVLQLKKEIEEMSKDRQVKILQILKSDTGTKLNSNKNGVFVNMTTLSLPVLRQLHAFVAYAEEEERDFSNFERQKQQLMQTHFLHTATATATADGDNIPRLGVEENEAEGANARRSGW